MAHGLTEKQALVLDFITHHYAEHGVAPTHSEIAAAFDIASSNGVTCHLRALVGKGMLKQVKRKRARCYVPTRRKIPLFTLDNVGLLSEQRWGLT